jgi:hypothetical protein
MEAACLKVTETHDEVDTVGSRVPGVEVVAQFHLRLRWVGSVPRAVLRWHHDESSEGPKMEESVPSPVNPEDFVDSLIADVSGI